METTRSRRPVPTLVDLYSDQKIQLFRPREVVRDGAGDSSLLSWFNSMKEYILVIMGFVMTAMGIFGLGLVISSPSNPLGGIVYILTGICIAFSYSESLRFYVLRSLSKKMYEMLYEKSILEIMMEPSPLMKVFVLICLSGTLESHDMNELVNSLPPSCDILKKRGMVNLLPRMVIE